MLYKYWANILKNFADIFLTFGKHAAKSILQDQCKYCTNIVQILNKSEYCTIIEVALHMAKHDHTQVPSTNKPKCLSLSPLLPISLLKNFNHIYQSFEFGKNPDRPPPSQNNLHFELWTILISALSLTYYI